jgi:hypothetical protein
MFLLSMTSRRNDGMARGCAHFGKEYRAPRTSLMPNSQTLLSSQRVSMM